MNSLWSEFRNLKHGSHLKVEVAGRQESNRIRARLYSKLRNNRDWHIQSWNEDGFLYLTKVSVPAQSNQLKKRRARQAT